jgi:hypothetical protein
LGEGLIRGEVAKLPEGSQKGDLLQRLERIKTSDDRDLLY